MTCAELQAKIDECNANATILQAAKDAAQADYDAAEAELMLVMNEVATKSATNSAAQAAIDSNNMQLTMFQMLFSMQGC